MKALKFLLISICLFFASILIAPGQDIPPDDGSGQELDVPLSGSEIFFILALGLGSFFIFKHNFVPKSKRKSITTKLKS